MSDLLGGDPAEMQAMAARFTRQADGVRAALSVLDREAAKIGTAWTGPGAMRFKDAWQSHRAPSGAWPRSSRRPPGSSPPIAATSSPPPADRTPRPGPPCPWAGAAR